MIKLLLPAILVLIVLGVVIFSIFNRPQTSDSNPTSQKTPANLNQTYAPIDLSEVKVTKVVEPEKPILVDLLAPNQTKASGYVRLSEVAGTILIQLKSDSSADKVSILYKGSCKDNGEIAYPLALLKDGKSQTIWDTDMETIEKNFPLSIKVFKDGKNLKTYTRCADIKMI